jgi:hypothetical protein
MKDINLNVNDGPIEKNMSEIQSDNNNQRETQSKTQRNYCGWSRSLLMDC